MPAETGTLTREARNVERESTAAPAPRVSVHAAARPRLFAQLNDAVRFPLAVVRGPAGAGKTALLADWPSRPPEQGGPGTAYAWLQTDALAALPADGQRRAFWQLAAAALGLGGHDEPFESVLRSSPVPRLLVVDGAHLLAGPALEEDLVRLARSELPLHILLATRTVLGLERRLPLLDIDIAVVGPDELRLTAAETHAVLAGGWLAECSAEVHERTAGQPWLVRAAKLRAAAAAAGRPHRNRAGAVYTLLAADAAAALDALAPCP
ncbi:hypothetical protein HER39_09490, partial [Arthrobacter deserti]|nr:hypothetical protein [Arthrobacter deserti]